MKAGAIVLCIQFPVPVRRYALKVVEHLADVWKNPAATAARLKVTCKFKYVKCNTVDVSAKTEKIKTEYHIEKRCINKKFYISWTLTKIIYLLVIKVHLLYYAEFTFQPLG